MKLNIFFTNEIDRIEFLHKQLNIKDIDIHDKHTVNSKVDGIDSLNFKNYFERIPGYWLELNFSRNKKGKELYNILKNVVPINNLNNNVFYPTDSRLSFKDLHIGWINKYSFSIKVSYEDKWKLFFKELKSHLKYKRIDIVFSGLGLILKYNPFFLKKYKRYYILEELAYLYEEKGNLKRAIKCLSLQSVLNPESIEPYLNMSSFYIINGLEEDAIKICKAGLKKNPQDQYLISNLIIALCNIENYSYALVFLKKVLDKDKKNKLFWKLMGDVYYEIDDHNDAIKCYKTALSIKECDDEYIVGFYIDLYSAVGACYFEEENYAEAVKYYKKALKYNSKDMYVLLSLSQIYLYCIEDINLAFKYTKLLVEYAPDSGFGQYQLGLIYFDKGNIEKAKWHLYKARRLMPNYEPIQDAIKALKRNIDYEK